MFADRHGPRAVAMIQERIESLSDEGDLLGAALYVAVAAQISQMHQSAASH